MLKDAGFDWDVDRYYTTSGSVCGACGNFSNHNAVKWEERFSAPSLAVAAKWLRTVKFIAVNVAAQDGDLYDWGETFLSKFREPGDDWYEYHTPPQVPSYEMALENGLKTMLGTVLKFDL